MMAYIHTLSYGAGIGNSIAKEIYEALLRLGNGYPINGLLKPNSERPYTQRQRNAQLGLFDDLFILEDSKRFDSHLSKEFASHPILSHPKIHLEGAKFLNYFYETIRENTNHKNPKTLISSIAKSRFYQYVITSLCTQRSKNKDGYIDEQKMQDSKEKIERKIILLQDIANNYNDLGRFLNAMILSASESTQGQGVNLLSIHASKGLEFGMVFIIDLMDGRFPNRKLMAKQGSLEEERRLFYVSVTRAKEFLYLSFAKKDAIKNIDYEPSIFLYEANLIESKNL